MSGRRLAVIGVPSGAGACGIGQDEAPRALRHAGLIAELTRVGFEVNDLGDAPAVSWRPDRENPLAQNLGKVVEVVRETADRVAQALSGDDTTVLVLGGDCTVGIGTMAGVGRAVGDAALAYFDVHSDLNIPATAGDGALDWMALAHMLAIDGAEPSLVTAAGRAPVLEPGQVVLFGHGRGQSTRFERSQIVQLGLARVPVEDVASDPEGAARRALDLIAERAGRYAIHLDVDVVDFTDAPLSEQTARNTGLKLDEMIRALRVLSSRPGLTAITLTELTPRNAAVEDGLLERFTSSFATAIA